MRKHIDIHIDRIVIECVRGTIIPFAEFTDLNNRKLYLALSQDIIEACDIRECSNIRVYYEHPGHSMISLRNHGENQAEPFSTFHACKGRCPDCQTGIEREEGSDIWYCPNPIHQQKP